MLTSQKLFYSSIHTCKLTLFGLGFMRVARLGEIWGGGMGGGGGDGAKSARGL